MIYFLIYLFLEIAVSIPVFSALGILGTFAEILLSAFIGFFLLANSSYTLRESFGALRDGSISPFAFQSISLMTIFGAFMLIIPGVFTDILGILLQFGFIATVISGYVVKKDKNNEIRRGENEDIIDVEVIEHSDTK